MVSIGSRQPDGVHLHHESGKTLREPAGAPSGHASGALDRSVFLASINVRFHLRRESNSHELSAKLTHDRSFEIVARAARIGPGKSVVVTKLRKGEQPEETTGLVLASMLDRHRTVPIQRLQLTPPSVYPEDVQEAIRTEGDPRDTSVGRIMELALHGLGKEVENFDFEAVAWRRNGRPGLVPSFAVNANLKDEGVMGRLRRLPLHVPRPLPARVDLSEYAARAAALRQASARDVDEQQ